MSVDWLVIGIKKVQAGFQLFNCLLLKGPLLNYVPGREM